MKTVKMKLVGLDGNAFSLLGAFAREARRQGWKQSEIDSVRKEATCGDYNHLLRTLMEFTEDPEEEEEEEEYDEEMYIDNAYPEGEAEFEEDKNV